MKNNIRLYQDLENNTGTLQIFLYKGIFVLPLFNYYIIYLKRCFRGNFENFQYSVVSTFSVEMTANARNIDCVTVSSPWKELMRFAAEPIGFRYLQRIATEKVKSSRPLTVLEVAAIDI